MGYEDKKVPQIMLPRGCAGKLTLRMMNLMHGSIYKNTAEVLRLQADDDVLDIACGNGHFLKKYASHARSVAGLDLSQLCVAEAGTSTGGASRPR